MKRRRALLLSITVVIALCAACAWWLHKERQQYARNRQLIDALTHDNTKRALTLVNAGADPNTCVEPPPAPSFSLLLAHLLHRTNLPVNNSPTALMIACGTSWTPPGNTPETGITDEDLPLLQAMLAHRATVHARAWNAITALHSAVAAKRLHTTQLLLQHGADVNAQDEEGMTPLIMAAANDTLNLTPLLLAHGADPNIQDVDGFTALYVSVTSITAKVTLPELLAHGANPNLRTKAGLTPLQLAQQQKRSDLVRLLTQNRFSQKKQMTHNNH